MAESNLQADEKDRHNLIQVIDGGYTSILIDFVS